MGYPQELVCRPSRGNVAKCRYRLHTPPGILCFRTDRACKSNKRDGGATLFINQRWCSSPKQSFAYTKDNIETTVVTCRTKRSCEFPSFNICSIYISPSTRTPQLTAFFDPFIAFLKPLPSDSLALVSGDFNKFSIRSFSLLGLDNIVHYLRGIRLTLITFM